MRRIATIALVALCVPAVEARAQDVEVLGARYGTTPPASYYAEMIRNPRAFQFSTGRSAIFAAPTGRGGPFERMRVLGPRSGPVTGTIEVPVVLGLYSDSPAQPPFTRDSMQVAYFGPQPGTITDYYHEQSQNLATLTGVLEDWQQINITAANITNGQSGLFSDPTLQSGAGAFVYHVLSQQTGVDWGRYDNDGPDGLPNSGDDDGFVDVVAVFHPDRGAECGGGGDRLWSHRWSLAAAAGTVFETTTPHFNGVDFIKINDYTVQPGLACNGSDLAQIGVFAHELGHAFGLPDLYDTRPNTDPDRHSGSGVWDLMATGSWGCDNYSPASPCHMGVWSKEQLGWLNLTTLAPDTDHGTVTLQPIETTNDAIRIDAADGSGEYLLIENRQRLGYDGQLFNEGLLIWQIDPDRATSLWPGNDVNAANEMSVWVRQADGLEDLGSPGQGRGDSGDPFPGIDSVTAFHAGTPEAPLSYQGGHLGISIFDIAASGDDMTFRAVTGFRTVTLQSQGSASPTGIFTVDGLQVDPPATAFTSPPFLSRQIEAVPGEPTGAGERRPFVQWSDDPAALASRTLVTPLTDTTFTAEYGGTQYELAIALAGDAFGVAPGTLSWTPTAPDLWFSPGTDVTVTAVAGTGFAFVDWGGALLGQGNPASVTLNTPLAADANFDLVFDIASAQVPIVAATEIDLTLQIDSGTAPISWAVTNGSVPPGLTIVGNGRVTGAALEPGSFPVTVRATDSRGLEAEATVNFEISEPALTTAQVMSPFLLTGPSLSQPERDYLNHTGNGLANYDLGDLRAWILANPNAPLSATFGATPMRDGVIVLPARWKEPGESR